MINDDDEFNELRRAVSLCRALGVTSLRWKGLEFELGPPHSAVPVEAPESVKPVDNETPEVKTSKLGKDRLTAEQQLELYGRVLDAEE